MEDKELTTLIERAQAGDQGAMEVLLQKAHTPVSYQCRKLLRDPRDAEDMTQEVLLLVYTRLSLLKNPTDYWGWLNSITVNRCMNALKRTHIELQFAEDEDGHSVLDNLEELDEQWVPDKALDNTETTRMIEEIVSALPEAQRICTLMYYYDEMSVREIAEAVGVPENTVKSRLNYARKAIKERVLDYEKQGVKLYGLSPLPFMLYFLLHAAEETAPPLLLPGPQCRRERGCSPGRRRRETDHGRRRNHYFRSCRGGFLRGDGGGRRGGLHRRNRRGPRIERSVRKSHSRSFGGRAGSGRYRGNGGPRQPGG